MAHRFNAPALDPAVAPAHSPAVAPALDPAVGVVVVLPTYQEAASIESVLRAVRRHLPSATILVVDDASPDGTGELAAKVGQELGAVEVLARPAKSGLGSAYKDGFAWAAERGAHIAVEMDADGSHDAAVLPALVGAVAYGADLAIGSRYVPGGAIAGWGLYRRALSRWGNRYAALALGLAVNDATSGFRAYATSMLRQIDLARVRADGYGFQIELTYRTVRAGGRVVEVPIVFSDRAMGESKMSGRIIVEALGLVTLWGGRDLVFGRRRRR